MAAALHVDLRTSIKFMNQSRNYRASLTAHLLCPRRSQSPNFASLPLT
uniref:Uncharacterized protein n=1 Tax=Arundo donax TaxID=35708 RepID=A0A0A8YTW5_ARUDO